MQKFVVVGFIDRAGCNKSEVGSLLLEYYENGALKFAGSCGKDGTCELALIYATPLEDWIDKPALDLGEVKPAAGLSASRVGSDG